MKAGPGRLTFSTAVTHVPVDVTNGDVQVNAPANLGPVRLTNAAASLSGNGTVDGIAGPADGPAVGLVSPNGGTGVPVGSLNTGPVEWGAQSRFRVDLVSPASHDRLLVTGYAPEIYFYARRPFAGGQKVYIEGYYRAPADEALVQERLRDRPARFIVFMTDEAAVWRASYPNVNADIEADYASFAQIPIDDERTVDLRVNRASVPTGLDAATGWPCYK